MKGTLKRLRIWQKLLISSLAYALPIAVLLYYAISGFNDSIRFAEKEIYGVRVLGPLTGLLDSMTEHERLAHEQLMGTSDLKARVQDVAKRIGEEFTALNDTLVYTAPVLGLTDEALKEAHVEHLLPSAISNRWQDLAKRLDGMTPRQSDAAHDAVVQNLLGLIGRVGDASNLILDPDLDSYYMMDVVLLSLPRAQARLGELMIFGERILAPWAISSERKLSKKDLVRLAMFETQIEERDVGHVVQSASTAIREDTNYFGEDPVLQKEMPPVLDRYRQAGQALMDVLKNISDEPTQGVGMPEFVEACTRFREAGSAMRVTSLKALNSLVERRLGHYEQRLLTTILVSFGALVLAVGLVIIISFGITKPLGRVMDIATEIASGRLDDAKRRLEESGAVADPGVGEAEGAEKDGVKDEIWQLSEVFTRMTFVLHSLVQQVRHSGIQVVSSATEISSSARELEATASQQASSILQVSTTAKEISAGSASLAKTMCDVANVASGTAALARDGQVGLQGIESTMKQLMEATVSIASKLDAISGKTNNIGTIVTTITKVADQTNLLSLNAAIEAEKAGEYGRGFSVVAREIRRLADQTAVATLDIERMVKEMQSAVSSGVMEVDKFVQQVRHGGTAVERIAGQIASIIQQVQTLIPQVDAVNQAMEVHSTGAGEISDAMSQLSEGAQQTRDVVGEFNRTARHLTSAVQELHDEVSRFNVGNQA